MASLIPYTKRLFVQRVRKHINDGYPQDDFSASDNEILLYIDQCIPSVLKSQMFENAKVTGVLDVPEAYLVSYGFTLTNKTTTGREWYVTLPQTPLELPTGYDITNVYIADPERGRSDNALPIKNKRVAFRNYMPRPNGFCYRLEGSTMFLSMTDGGSLLNFNLEVQMPVSRTTSMDETMNLPDGALEPIFQKVVAMLIQRMQLPKDVIEDDITQGNKTS